jgi:uncharacterized protein involved in exopolysaccharide biosynthesis
MKSDFTFESYPSQMSADGWHGDGECLLNTDEVMARIRQNLMEAGTMSECDHNGDAYEVGTTLIDVLHRLVERQTTIESGLHGVAEQLSSLPRADAGVEVLTSELAVLRGAHEKAVARTVALAERVERLTRELSDARHAAERAAETAAGLARLSREVDELRSMVATPALSADDSVWGIRRALRWLFGWAGASAPTNP